MRMHMNPMILAIGMCVVAPMAPVAMAGAAPAPTPEMVPEMDMSGSDNSQGALGPYGMSRDASGTSWQPDSTPMEGVHTVSGPWMFMTHGNLTGIYTDQSGPRGDSQTFNESMFMVMARRPLGDDVISGRFMTSLEPLNGPGGYPLLFQTGETANGRDPLIDRQHPHNLLMEVSGIYDKTLSNSASVFLYAAPVGEPALGPPVYMHRASSEDNPDAPLTHHWLDSTHVAFGVVTVGAVWRDWKIEASSFNGREPDEHRYSVQYRSFDSWSTRISYDPTVHLSLQISTGYLASPEQLQPATSEQRTTASAIYDLPVGDAHWQSTLAWGRDAPEGEIRTDGYLLDSALHLGGGHTLFMRYEHVVKDDLFPPGGTLYGQPFPIQKASVGYVFDFLEVSHLRFGIGAVFSRFRFPSALDPYYGNDPYGFSVFARVKLVP